MDRSLGMVALATLCMHLLAAWPAGALAARSGPQSQESTAADPAPRTAPNALPPAAAATRVAAVDRYAALAEAEYRASLEAAETMRSAIRAFCATPSAEGLARARECWIAARDRYGRTEVLRFGNGPIDTRRGGVETLLNAWPVDEAYIEAEEPSAGPPSGIIADAARYPSLGRAILALHNQRGGETNVCTGWHAIEFMLWGRDRSETGPGDRSHLDFVDGQRPFADRRREYLLEITDLLCEQLASLVAAWSPEGSTHRQRFVADPERALRAMLTGAAILSGFEMAGERLAVALETRDQEEEHSCFSDTTDRDFKANIRGIELVLRGQGGPGLIAVVAEVDAARATSLDRALGAAIAAVDAIPAPFDAAIRSAEGSPQRDTLTAAIEALETLSEELGRAGSAMGWSIPTEPQG